MTAWGVYAHQKSKYSAICMMAFMIFLTFVISFKLVSNSYSINHLIQLAHLIYMHEPRTIELLSRKYGLCQSPS